MCARRDLLLLHSPTMMSMDHIAKTPTSSRFHLEISMNVRTQRSSLKTGVTITIRRRLSLRSPSDTHSGIGWENSLSPPYNAESLNNVKLNTVKKKHTVLSHGITVGVVSSGPARIGMRSAARLLGRRYDAMRCLLTLTQVSLQSSLAWELPLTHMHCSQDSDH